jgi:hypothetical protein
LFQNPERLKMQKRAILVGFVVLGLLATLGARLFAGQAAPEANKSSVDSSKVVAFYFHGTNRCVTCRKIEAFSREAIQTGFGEALKTGRLEWRAINVEEPANQHFIKDYKLYTRSLVLVSFEGEKQLRWKNLDQVWLLVGDKPKFTSYVQGEVKSFLEAR